jgi:hypothetical protein
MLLEFSWGLCWTCRLLLVVWPFPQCWFCKSMNTGDLSIFWHLLWFFNPQRVNTPMKKQAQELGNSQRKRYKWPVSIWRTVQLPWL